MSLNQKGAAAMHRALSQAMSWRNTLWWRSRFTPRAGSAILVTHVRGVVLYELMWQFSIAWCLLDD